MAQLLVRDLNEVTVERLKERKIIKKRKRPAYNRRVRVFSYPHWDIRLLCNGAIEAAQERPTAREDNPSFVDVCHEFRGSELDGRFNVFDDRF